ncbi:hypothetical protein [Companilactobacillus insicii]|uniref:hypothetical protein n=1 Tax=Companilactobacillus insicii TaxID=1732567 RepID=UPI000F7A062C|nr:hypothetical protein [Companilactobacillus insicii]
MINLNSKNGQKLMTAGNWIWSLFTINVSFFLINFSVILTAIILSSLPMSASYYVVLFVTGLMLSLFTIPSLTASFSAVQEWQVNGSGSFFKYFFKKWFESLRDYKVNFGFGAVGIVMIALNKVASGNTQWHTVVLTFSFVYLMALVAATFQSATKESDNTLTLLVSKPFLTIISVIVFLILILINFVLQLAFLSVICSISLATYVSYRLLGGRMEKND